MAGQTGDLMKLLFVFAVIFLFPAFAGAQVAPETVREEKLAKPTDSWFLAKGFEGAFIVDSATGDMQGTLGAGFFTPAVEPNFPRGEIYAAESFYDRGFRGKRTDVLTIFETERLVAIAEVKIPPKTTPLWFRHYIGMLNDDRHVVVFNMTPAQSVSVVDVIDREFTSEISTAGCALMLPVEERAFIMVCGDGTLQMIGLNEKGRESSRTRSEAFFNVEEDAVFDQFARTSDGWLMVSRNGKVFHVTAQGKEIKISEAWSLVNEEDAGEKWRPGGGQPFAFHRGSHVLYVLMHQGEIDTHYEPGTEVWLFDLDRKKRIGRRELEKPSTALQVTQEASGRLLTVNSEQQIDVYDGKTLQHQRAIKAAMEVNYLQTLGNDD